MVGGDDGDDDDNDDDDATGSACNQLICSCT